MCRTCISQHDAIERKPFIRRQFGQFLTPPNSRRRSWTAPYHGTCDRHCWMVVVVIVMRFSNLLKPAQSCSHLLKPSQTCSNQLKIAQTSSKLLDLLKSVHTCKKIKYFKNCLTMALERDIVECSWWWLWWVSGMGIAFWGWGIKIRHMKMVVVKHTVSFFCFISNDVTECVCATDANLLNNFLSFLLLVFLHFLVLPP